LRARAPPRPQAAIVVPRRSCRPKPLSRGGFAAPSRLRRGESADRKPRSSQALELRRRRHGKRPSSHSRRQSPSTLGPHDLAQSPVDRVLERARAQDLSGPGGELTVDVDGRLHGIRISDKPVPGYPKGGPRPGQRVPSAASQVAGTPRLR
jgi:hypothetical protein